MSTINTNAGSASSYQAQAPSTIGQGPTAEDMFARLDTDGDAVISSTEFVASFEARAAERADRGGQRSGCAHDGYAHGGPGRTPDEYAAAVQQAQARGGGAASNEQVAALQQQVANLTTQLETLIAQVYGAASSVVSSDAGAAYGSTGVTDATRAASSTATGASTTEQDGYQYATDEAGNTYAIDETGNVFAIAEDGTGTLVQAADASGNTYAVDANGTGSDVSSAIS